MNLTGSDVRCRGLDGAKGAEHQEIEVIHHKKCHEQEGSERIEQGYFLVGHKFVHAAAFQLDQGVYFFGDAAAQVTEFVAVN